MHGIRFTELLGLSYFNPIQGHAADQIHSLLLGTAKHTFLTWIKKGILNDAKIEKIYERKSELNCPSEVRRISQSMSLHKTMKSDE